MAEGIAKAWVCQAWHCGEIYEGTERFCPTCGNVARPQAHIRRAGAALVICGTLLAVIAGALIVNLGPTMMAAGEQVEGSRFSGTRRDAAVILGLFGAIGVFGLGAFVAGYIQLRHGRQNWRLVGGMLAVLTVICTLAWLVQNGFLLSR